MQLWTFEASEVMMFFILTFILPAQQALKNKRLMYNYNSFTSFSISTCSHCHRPRRWQARRSYKSRAKGWGWNERRSLLFLSKVCCWGMSLWHQKLMKILYNLRPKSFWTEVNIWWMDLVRDNVHYPGGEECSPTNNNHVDDMVPCHPVGVPMHIY